MKHEPAFSADEIRFTHGDGLARKTVFVGGKVGTVETTAVRGPDVLERLHNRATIDDRQHAAAIAWATDYERAGMATAVCANYGGGVAALSEAEPERRRQAKERFRRGYDAMSSSDLLSVENLQVSSAVLFFEELLSFVLIIVLGALFYKVLDTRQWFIFKKEPSFNFSVSKIIGFFQKIFNFFKKKKKASNFFIPRSIFALNFNQITFWGLFIAGIAAFLLPQDSTCLLDLFGRLQFSLGSLWLDLLLSKLILWLSFAFLLSLLCKVLCDDEITELFFEEKFPELAEELAFKKVIYALVALNPLLITEVLWNGHIEILLAFSFLALVYYAFKKNYLSFLVLGLGPALLYYLLRGFSLERIMTPHNSFYDLMNSINNYIGGEDLPYGFRYFFLSLFLVFVLWVLYRFFLNKDSESLFYYSFLLALVFLLIALPGFYSWYFVILIPLGALLHPRLIFLLSLTHLLSYTFLDDLSLVNYLLMTVIPSVFYFRYLLRQDV